MFGGVNFNLKGEVNIHTLGSQAIGAVTACCLAFIKNTYFIVITTSLHKAHTILCDLTKTVGTFDTQGIATVCEAFEGKPDVIFFGTKTETMIPTYDIAMTYENGEIRYKGAHSGPVTALEFVNWNH